MMQNYHPARVSLPDLGARTGEAAIDYALTLLVADEPEPSLRWGAAALEAHPGMTAALLVTSRALEQMGRARAAADGLRLAAQRATESGDLGLALAAIDDLRLLGLPIGELIDHLAVTFCRGSRRLREQSGGSPAGQYGDFVQPLSPFLSGPPLASKATQILLSAKRSFDTGAPDRPSSVPPLALFSSLSEEALRKLLGAFQIITVPAGHRLIQEGQPGTAGYIIARGEVEIARHASVGEDKPSLAISRLGAGAFFGEVALLAQIPSGATVTTTRPSILLVAERDVILALAAKRPELSIQLAAHCRRHALSNLGRASPFVAALPGPQRATLVERMEMRIFEAGERLARDGTEAEGVHFIVSGDVAIVAQDGADRVLLATLGLGETIGEVELVLCQRRYADAIALRPTATLFLSRDEYRGLAHDHPAILHSLYAVALRRHTETRLALEAGSGSSIPSAGVVDDDEPTVHRSSFTPTARSTPSRAAPSRRAPVEPPPLPDSAFVASVAPPSVSPRSLAPASLSIVPTIAPAMGAASGRTSSAWLAAGGALVGAAVASAVALISLGGAPPLLAHAAAAAPATTSLAAAERSTPAPPPIVARPAPSPTVSTIAAEALPVATAPLPAPPPPAPPPPAMTFRPAPAHHAPAAAKPRAPAVVSSVADGEAATSTPTLVASPSAPAAKPLADTRTLVAVPSPVRGDDFGGRE